MNHLPPRFGALALRTVFLHSDGQAEEPAQQSLDTHRFAKALVNNPRFGNQICTVGDRRKHGASPGTFSHRKLCQLGAHK
jgi:hypothetical protein